VTRQRLRWLRKVDPGSPGTWVAGLATLTVALGGVVWVQHVGEEPSAAATSATAATVTSAASPTETSTPQADRPRPSDRTSARPSEKPRHTPSAKPHASRHRSQAKDSPQSTPKSSKAKALASTVEKVVGEAATPATTFRLASFNVLGSSHTAKGGNKPRYASGVSRMRGATQLIGAAGADVVGFQEFEQPQFATFMNLTHGAWQTYPGMSMGRGPVRNSVAWRSDKFELVDRGTIPVPYFHGQRVPSPWVLLKHRATGRTIAFINIHNPVSNARRGNNERWRDVATSMEVALVRRLRPVAPVVLMGDFNERAEAFCRVTSGAGMHAANGGVPGSGCRPPAGAGIDWIFGTQDVGFSEYLRNQNSLVRRTTDHPLVTVTVTLDS
jgi:endonuclease/exonuclease/phosphatase family metal-dependent hydrolase